MSAAPLIQIRIRTRIRKLATLSILLGAAGPVWILFFLVPLVPPLDLFFDHVKQVWRGDVKNR